MLNSFFSPWAMQPVPWAFLASHDSTPVLPYKYLNAPAESDSKNSLCINITIPPQADEEALPVMSFIHGGGFTYGSSVLPTYDGFRLVSESMRKGKPVVFTSFNYRLGLLGFLASKDIAASLKTDGFQGNGNFALTDQKLALEWIHSYIDLFGGNKNEVTIFGESAGAMSAGLHALSRSPAPFQRVIYQSGSPGSFRPWSEEEHEVLYRKTLEYFNIDPHAPDALARLQAVPDADFVEGTHDIWGILEPLPSICLDGWFFEHNPCEAWLKPSPSWLKGQMVGDVRDEGMIFREEIKKEDFNSLTKAFDRYLSAEDKRWIFSLYGIKRDLGSSQLHSIIELMFTDTVFRCPDVGKAHISRSEASSIPTYMYHFDELNTFNNMYKDEAHHAYDLLYVFLTAYEAFDEDQRRVADAVHEAWITFAYGKDPWEDYRVLGRWQTFGPKGQVHLATEEEDETVRCYKRIDALLEKPELLKRFAQVVEDVTIRPYLIREERPKGWSKALLESLGIA